MPWTVPDMPWNFAGASATAVFSGGLGLSAAVSGIIARMDGAPHYGGGAKKNALDPRR